MSSDSGAGRAEHVIVAPHLQPYPAYKLSGLEWLANIPAHWRTERGKWLLKKMKRPVRDTDEVVTCFRDGVVTLRKNRRTEGFTESLQEIGYQGIREGDLVIHAMDAFAGAIGVADSDGKGTPVYSVCRPDPNDNAYYFAYILREMARSRWIAALATGIRERSTDFRYATLASQQLPLLPLAEQKAIVCHLDHVDGRIQRYIEAKEKLITLLQEARQAIIHRAVTRGLDPDVPFKPSGIEWLGDVPAHWEIRRLGHLATKFGSGITPRGGATVYQEIGVPFLRSQNIHFEGLRLKNVARISPELHKELAGSHVEPCDLLLNITGASIGRACSVPDSFTEGNVNQHVCIIRPDQSRMLPGLLAAYMSTPMMQHEIQIEQKGASREGLTLQSIRNFRVVVPPLPEQTGIVAYLDRSTANVDAAIDTSRHQSELMREYRTSLIAHVVTGKVDVRKAAAQLRLETSEEISTVR